MTALRNQKEIEFNQFVSWGERYVSILVFQIGSLYVKERIIEMEITYKKKKTRFINCTMQYYCPSSSRVYE